VSKYKKGCAWVHFTSAQSYLETLIKITADYIYIDMSVGYLSFHTLVHTTSFCRYLVQEIGLAVLLRTK
jgi:hypothetical protein